MAAKFGVEAAPTLLVACNGDPNTAERFEGEFKSGPITDFLSKFAGGRKCATAVKVRTQRHISSGFASLNHHGRRYSGLHLTVVLHMQTIGNVALMPGRALL